MPVTPDIFLQAATQAKAKAPPASAPVSSPEPGNKASSFARVYADQTPDKSAAAGNGSNEPIGKKTTEGPETQDSGEHSSAAVEPAVADDGKSLPVNHLVQADDKSASDETTDIEHKAVGDCAPIDPAYDPALAQVVQIVVPAPIATAAEAVVDPALAQAVQAAVPVPVPVSVSATAKTTVAPALTATDNDFNPEADPLDALPALRLAMEHSGHVSASSQGQAKAAPIPAQADGELTSAQNFAAGMASMLDMPPDKDSTSQGGDKAFSGLIDAGLKDLTSASSDTRVDNFANRLAELTQAATPKTANALPVNQPIAMHQSGWTQEVVNRVMYLSSTNLKAADIQLQPAELGRLDIRVNMVPDQQTQVTFMSAHPAVREALDGQMYRLRDMFAQQGMGQVDVNVSDQSRGSQQGQDQSQQAQRGRANAGGGGLDSMDDDLAPSVAEVAASTTSVIGSSAVDYYA